MRILSFDGGGIRGIVPAEVMRRLEKDNPFMPGVLAGADLLAGTSIGGILALGFAFGVSPTETLDLLLAHGHGIFDRRDWVDTCTGGIDEIFRADYSLGELEDALNEIFDCATIGDLDQRVLITAFDLQRWKPKFFNNDDPDVLLVDAALATAAAPVYFPAYADRWIDGGVYAQDPSDCAVAEALHLGHQLQDIHLLSFGTGRMEQSGIIGGDWGYKQWLKPPPKLLAVLFDGVSMATEFKCRQMLGDKYFRVNPDLPRAIGMDEADASQELLDAGSAFDVVQTVKWLAENWYGI